MTRFKLGQLPPEPDPKAKLLKNYLDRKAITPPATEPIDMSKYAAKYDYVMTAMMANGPDPVAPLKIAPFGVGDCVFAAAVRFAALEGLSRGRVLFKNAADMCTAALDGYASTGWDINQTDSQGNNPTDQGTIPNRAFKWLQTKGLLCSNGSRHKFGPMLQVNPLDFAEVIIAMNIAQGIMIGVNFPAAWDNSPIWDVTNTPLEGGHEIPGYSDLKLTTSGIQIDTWGNAAPGPRIITPGGLAQQCNQLTVIIDPLEFGFGRHGKKANGKRRRGRNIEGFNHAQWLADVAADGGF